jgi:hypothetical protein
MPQTVNEDVTLGEVFRSVQAMGQDLKGIATNLTAGLEKRPTWDDINRIESNRMAAEAAREAAVAATETLQNEAIKALQDNNKWLVRTAGAALVTGLLSAPIAIGVAVLTR